MSHRKKAVFDRLTIRSPIGCFCQQMALTNNLFENQTIIIYQTHLQCSSKNCAYPNSNSELSLSSQALCRLARPGGSVVQCISCSAVYLSIQYIAVTLQRYQFHSISLAVGRKQLHEPLAASFIIGLLVIVATSCALAVSSNSATIQCVFTRKFTFSYIRTYGTVNANFVPSLPVVCVFFRQYRHRLCLNQDPGHVTTTHTDCFENSTGKANCNTYPLPVRYFHNTYGIGQ